MLSEAAKKDPAMSGQLDFARIENDFYPTPPKYMNCLAQYFWMHDTKWWEPAAGKGHLVKAIEDITGKWCDRSDLIVYAEAEEAFKKTVVPMDFFTATASPRWHNGKSATGICTNPPYETVNLTDPEWAYLKPLAESYGMIANKVSLAELFLRHCLALMKPVLGKVALFLRNEFDCGKKRMDLFEDHPAYAMKIICTERPRWIEGSTGSPRHNYAWYCFDWANFDEAKVKYSHPTKATPLLP